MFWKNIILHDYFYFINFLTRFKKIRLKLEHIRKNYEMLIRILRYYSQVKLLIYKCMTIQVYKTPKTFKFSFYYSIYKYDLNMVKLFLSVTNF